MEQNKNFEFNEGPILGPSEHNPPIKAKLTKIEQTPIEMLEEMEKSQSIDVAAELEKILANELRLSIIEIVKEKDWTDEQKHKILTHKFKGKTIVEWDLEAREANGLDEKGNPAWYEPHSNVMDGYVIAQLLYLTDEQNNIDTGDLQ